MERRVTIGIIIALVGVVLVAGGFYVLFRIVRQTFAPLPQPATPALLTEKVVVAAHDIALGTELKTEDLTMLEVPVQLVPSSAAKEIKTAVGSITKANLAGGEILFAHHLADPTNSNQDLAFVLEDAQVLMAVPAGDLMSSLNVIQRGDVVDVYVSIEQEAPVVNITEDQAVVTSQQEEEESETLVFTFSAMQRVGITAMVIDVINQSRDSGASSRPSDVNVRAYLLALAPQDALVIKHLKDTGAKFDFVLRSPTSNELFELDTVTTDYLIDRYELEITR